MGFVIDDGTGSGGGSAQVKENKLLVSAVVSSQEHYANHNQGRAYSVVFAATPATANDCFFYMKNTDSTYALSIEGLWLKLAANEYLDLKVGDHGTPVGGTVITPTNLNTGSGLLASGTFQYGTGLTGLSSGITSHRIYHASSLGSVYHDFPQDIVLGSNGVLTMYAQTGGTEVACTFEINYHGTNN